MPRMPSFGHLLKPLARTPKTGFNSEDPQLSTSPHPLQEPGPPNVRGELHVADVEDTGGHQVSSSCLC